MSFSDIYQFYVEFTMGLLIYGLDRNHLMLFAAGNVFMFAGLLAFTEVRMDKDYKGSLVPVKYDIDLKASTLTVGLTISLVMGAIAVLFENRFVVLIQMWFGYAWHVRSVFNTGVEYDKPGNAFTVFYWIALLSVIISSAILN